MRSQLALPDVWVALRLTAVTTPIMALPYRRCHLLLSCR
jgi:hypothetical protein